MRIFVVDFIRILRSLRKACIQLCRCNPSFIQCCRCSVASRTSRRVICWVIRCFAILTKTERFPVWKQPFMRLLYICAQYCFIILHFKTCVRKTGMAGMAPWWEKSKTRLGELWGRIPYCFQDGRIKLGVVLQAAWDSIPGCRFLISGHLVLVLRMG